MVDPATARRIEQSLAASARLYAQDHRRRFPEHGAEVLEVEGGGGGLAVWGSAFGAPSVSRAFALGVSGAVTTEALDRVEDLYARHASGVRVVTSPWTHPSLLGLLAARGYVATRFDNVLTRPLGPRAERQGDPAVKVARVGPGEAVAWGRIVRAGFDMDLADERGDIIDGAFEGSTTAALFLATVDGAPAGGGAIVVHDGVGVLFATATLSAHRRRGVHAALVAARLAHADELGADLAVVTTDPGSDSQRNLETKCGFRVGYTQVLFETALSTAPSSRSRP